MKPNFKKNIPIMIRDRKWVAMFAPIPIDPDGSQLYGDSEHGVQVIRISTNMHPQVVAETALHEALHACWSMTGLDRLGGRVLEEDVVVGLSNALVPFIVENPEFMALIMKLHRMDGW